MMRRSITVTLLCLLAFVEASAQEPVAPWRSDPVFKRLAAELGRRAIAARNVRTNTRIVHGEIRSNRLRERNL